MQSQRIFTITSLSKQEKRPWRTSIFTNGEFWRAFDTETVIELGFYEGQKLTADELHKLDHALEKRRAVNRAVLLMSYRARSAHEISTRLAKAGFSPQIIAETVDELKRLGYLDDEAFTQSWIDSRINSKLYGSRRIKQELKLKGIPDDVISDKIEENVSEDDELARAELLANSKLSHYKNLDRNTTFRKLSQFLIRRGYSASTAYEVCKKLL